MTPVSILKPPALFNKYRKSVLLHMSLKDKNKSDPESVERHSDYNPAVHLRSVLHVELFLTKRTYKTNVVLPTLDFVTLKFHTYRIQIVVLSSKIDDRKIKSIFSLIISYKFLFMCKLVRNGMS